MLVGRAGSVSLTLMSVFIVMNFISKVISE